MLNERILVHILCLCLSFIVYYYLILSFISFECSYLVMLGSFSIIFFLSYLKNPRQWKIYIDRSFDYLYLFFITFSTKPYSPGNRIDIVWSDSSCLQFSARHISFSGANKWYFLRVIMYYLRQFWQKPCLHSNYKIC